MYILAVPRTAEETQADLEGRRREEGLMGLDATEASLSSGLSTAPVAAEESGSDHKNVTAYFSG